MLLLICLLIVAAIMLIFIGITGGSRFSSRKIVLPKNETQIQHYDLLTNKFLGRLKLVELIKNRLYAAHSHLSVQRFLSVKLILMAAFGTLSYFVLGRLEPVGILAGIALGYILPDIWLTKKISHRKYEIARVLPETVDLLGLCVEAGLDFTTAVKWIVEKKITSNPMIEELTLILEEIRWGKPRAQALKDMAKRLNIPEVSSFVRALVQAERMGTPISESFGIISEDTRMQRFRRGERYALQAPIKILIPLIFCILPVIGIVIAGPVLIQFTQGSLFSGFGK